MASWARDLAASSDGIKSVWPFLFTCFSPCFFPSPLPLAQRAIPPGLLFLYRVLVQAPDTFSCMVVASTWWPWGPLVGGSIPKRARRLDFKWSRQVSCVPFTVVLPVVRMQATHLPRRVPARVQSVTWGVAARSDLIIYPRQPLERCNL